MRVWLGWSPGLGSLVGLRSSFWPGLQSLETWLWDLLQAHSMTVGRNLHFFTSWVSPERESTKDGSRSAL